MALANPVVCSAKVKESLHVIGKRYYGEVVYFGISVAGKRTRQTLYTSTPTNEEVQSANEFLQNECTRMSKLNHPNLVAFLGVCLQHQPILVMELLPMSLTGYLEKYANIPSNIKNLILLDVLHDLLYHHNQTPPIAHRDLTANNYDVLLTSGLRAKIADFGVSRAVEPDIREHYFRMSTAPGNMYYMLPEAKLPTKFEENISNGDKLDILSLGVLIAHVYNQLWPIPIGTHSETTRLPLTEVQQRMTYIDAIDDEVVKKLSQDCLQIFPKEWPHISEVIAILQDAHSEMEAVRMLMERDANANAEENEENTQFKEENDRFKEKIAQFKEEIAQFEEKIAQSKEEIAQFKEEIAQFEEEIAQFKEEIAQFEEEIAQFEEEIAQFEEEIAQFKEEIAQFKEKIAQFEEKIAQFEEEIAQFKEKIAQFEEEIAQYKRKNTQLRRKNTQIKEENEKECTQMKQKLHDLEAKLLSEKQEKEENIESLQLELERQKEELRNSIAQQAQPLLQVPSDSILRSIATGDSRELGCQMIEMAYSHCQRVIFEELNKSLCKVTTSDVMCQAEDSSHQKVFAQTAYRLLCHHTVEDKVEYPKEVLTNVLRDFFGQFSVPDESHAAVTERIKQAISLSWKLLTKGPPLTLFQPTEYDSSLLDTDEKTWKGDYRRSMNTVITISDNPTSEDIEQKFHEYFNDIELLPRKLKVKNTELWPVCCKIFQTSFECCRDEFLYSLVKPLYSLTKMTEDEKETGLIDFERQEKLKDIKLAFKILRDYSLPELKQVDSSIVEKVKTSVFPESSPDSGLSPEKQDELIKRAVEICWKMLMLSCPMFVCQPKGYSDNLHETHRKSWHDGPGELVYYRPVLMSCAGGTRAIKGLVGKKLSTDKANDAGQSSSLPADEGDGAIAPVNNYLIIQCKLTTCKFCSAKLKDTGIYYCHDCLTQLMSKGCYDTAPHFCMKCPFCSIDTGKFVADFVHCYED